ncbi:HAMP domain-containing methyl-accepting chemotaxis protein [Phenylobacterium sp.]|uniref:methyl-accepting chemotaxis protein n=1 Tax=Phenylobacterium sp. TaxID=1871053 RepID=UPI00281107A8|nr:HAMP domain-containing methyl-accepting chemotaxis protein [Phenylobacterium sp.]
MLRTIRQKVTAAGAAVLVLCVSSAGAGLWVASTLDGALERSARSEAVQRNHMQADMMHDALRGDVLSALQAGNPVLGVTMDDVKRDLAEHKAEFRSAVAESVKLAPDAGIRAALTQLEAPLAGYMTAADSIIARAETDPMGAQGQYAAFAEAFGVLETAMAEASDKIGAAAAADAKAAREHAALGQLLMSVAIGAGVLFAGGLILMARRTVVRPILDLADDMRRLAGGDLDVALKGAERPDEVGEIGRAVRAFQEVIVARTRAEADEADARRRAAADAEAREQAERLARARAQAKVVEDLAQGLRRLADGELDFRLTDAFEGEYESLRADYNEAMGRMEETLRTIIGAAEAIRTGALEIGNASQDLSRRTEQQAANLEETAAALDEITATVKTSAEGADEAQRAVSNSKQEAEQSGEVVRQAVQAMDQIEESARQISQIIGVMDEIAFQTNLLALNAGVEAARAGEAGKGFAVVASEVRALAQRSADAAKEIKTLISASTGQVSEGVELVGRAGQALDRIAGQVAGIDRLVSEISLSSREQSVSLGQINTAVNQMDQMTQQNAAMVEQSTAATMALNTQVDHLFGLVGQFRVGQPQDWAPDERRVA